MKRKLNINGREIEVEIISKTATSITFNYESKEFSFILKKEKNGEIQLSDQQGKSYKVFSDGEILDSKDGQFKIQSIKRTSQSNSHETQNTILSPLPGKVIKVSANEGGEVNEGDEILRIEAMKMEHRICAQASGLLKSINVKVGDTVSDGELLGEIE